MYNSLFSIISPLVFYCHYESSAEREHMDVDARVWNAAQGYFEYPPESIPLSKSSSSSKLLTPQLLVRGEKKYCFLVEK